MAVWNTGIGLLLRLPHSTPHSTLDGSSPALLMSWFKMQAVGAREALAWERRSGLSAKSKGYKRLPGEKDPKYQSPAQILRGVTTRVAHTNRVIAASDLSVTAEDREDRAGLTVERGAGEYRALRYTHLLLARSLVPWLRQLLPVVSGHMVPLITVMNM
ncbi:unnamed protein product [Ranitomeya imitator]|uniref:Uncharacterized protein n=1 Tax=Ranitomeya imitator TaxID=111125 RepID=A0ABN9M5R7_9NEOB|nr:unnamed protein product [Ranitomeya imitator]